MAKLVGKYQLTENKNFYEFLLSLDVPEEKAKLAKEIKGTIEVKVDGNRVTVANDHAPNVTDFIIGQEVDETVGKDTLLKSTASLNGNVLTVSSKKDGSPSGTRTYTFSDSGLEVTFNTPKDGKTYSASRIYKRV